MKVHKLLQDSSPFLHSLTELWAIFLGKTGRLKEKFLNSQVSPEETSGYLSETPYSTAPSSITPAHKELFSFTFTAFLSNSESLDSRRMPST